jgi:hypothetical protein
MRRAMCRPWMTEREECSSGCPTRKRTRGVEGIRRRGQGGGRSARRFRPARSQVGGGGPSGPHKGPSMRIPRFLRNGRIVWARHHAMDLYLLIRCEAGQPARASSWFKSSHLKNVALLVACERMESNNKNNTLTQLISLP